MSLWEIVRQVFQGSTENDENDDSNPSDQDNKDIQEQTWNIDLNDSLADAKPPDVSNGENMVSGPSYHGEVNENPQVQAAEHPDSGGDNQSDAEWYDRTWREIKAANPKWTDQQVYDEMTRRINEADWNARYQNVITDIANSSTPAELEQKINYYKSELDAFRDSGINVDNDLMYLRNTSSMNPVTEKNNTFTIDYSFIPDLERAFTKNLQYNLPPDSTAAIDSELTDQDKDNNIHLEPVDGILRKFDSQDRMLSEDLYKCLELQDAFARKFEEFNSGKFEIGGYGFKIVDDTEKQKAMLRAMTRDFGEGMNFMLPWVGSGGLTGVSKGIKTAEEFGLVTEKIAKESSKAVTGARDITYDEWLKLEVQAKRMYNDIRNSPTDVSSIAKNTGMSETRVQRIKNHVFNNEHILWDGIRRFDPDYDIAQVWNRLERGTYNENDIRLLNHELFESKFEGIFKTDYETAHDATIRSGREWKPIEEE